MPPPAMVARGCPTPPRKNKCWTFAATKSTLVLDGCIKTEPEREPVQKTVSSPSGMTSCRDPWKKGFCEDSNSKWLDVTTRAMLDVLQRKHTVLVIQRKGLLPPSGSLKRNGVKYRFMVTETIGEDPLKQTQNHEAGNRNAPRLAKKNRSARKHPLRSTSCQIEPSVSVGKRPKTTVKKKKVFTTESMP
ncbi:hypothetical protein HPB52_014235 [Rhipicephalus sanguineus]|uniref:Uncharacterized protein n=1 Tax=Rhipicephalus sanguineus TaxID=34632 RepID=A0A9D4TAB9_RHISA|nr:hypothetical protein HPB52_014235 [Rhipicephalus sanguineus]